MLVCHVVSGLMYGGGQRVALDLASRFQHQVGTTSLLVLLGETLVPDFPPINDQWVQIHSYDGRYNRPSSVARAAWELRRVLRARNVDIAHSHGWDADVIVGLASRGLGLHHVVHQHILADWASSPRIVHRIRRGLTRVALEGPRTSWVAVSHAVRESLRALNWLPDASVQVIWNGVDPERFSPGHPAVERVRPVIGVAARLAPMKGLEYLVDAVAQLNARGVLCDLSLVGDGPSRSGLEAMVHAHGISDRVSFQGQRRDMPSFYRSIDILALPSVSLEGLPLSILEAMATGVPVVSTLVSGIPEAVMDGVSGALVAPRDAAALAVALEPLLRSRALRVQMGQAGRERIKTLFSMDRMVGQVAELYGKAAAAAA